ncbi:MAG: SRPBCC domain-containing protein, partial [Cyanobacteria bacterium P01_E01_bin.43]
MPTLRTEIEINAPRSLIWEALMRKDEWRRWNTFLFDGDPALAIHQGREIFLSIRRLEDDESTDFEPLITLVQPHVCLRWVARMPGFKSEHSFEMQDL